MTVAEMLREMKAAHAARTAYQRAADRLGELAIELWREGWTSWSREVAGMALRVQRAARAEYE